MTKEQDLGPSQTTGISVPIKLFNFVTNKAWELKLTRSGYIQKLIEKEYRADQRKQSRKK